ncbi:hypothetical protein [uncultured Mesonia sp.]|uniref:hypothetical protein n=1 Tax=uncultured Mesonia sp. TaxID=399731 RepID=UPI00374F2A13
MISKEFGSDFHYYQSNVINAEYSIFNEEHLSLFLSGRAALYNLLNYGIEKFGWCKVGFPSYYCHEVVDFCRNLPIEVDYYNYNPFIHRSLDWEDDEKSVFISVNFFGISKLDTSFLKKSIIIEDITHNLLSFKTSSANYCFGSLRKQLPLPAGGFCYDPNKDLSVDLEVDNLSDKIVLQKLTAMLLKSKFLKDENIEKKMFRSLYIESEKLFELIKPDSAIPDILKKMIFQFNYKNLLEKTQSNIQLAKRKWRSNRKVKLLSSNQNSEMGLLLLCDNHKTRESLKGFLIDSNIYPAILWPNQKTKKDRFFEQKMLFIHSDFRYDNEDVRFIIKQLNFFTANV